MSPSDQSHSERILRVEPYEGMHDFGKEAGFRVVTDQQTIVLAIDDESSCCESWGYFLTEDDAAKFVGAELRGVTITDTNRSARIFVKGWNDAPYDDQHEHLDEGDVMFVDIETDRGVLQFVAYNAHNGYYGHTARVSSRQLTHEEVL